MNEEQETEELTDEQVLPELYDDTREDGGSDAAAMQAVVCILLIVGLVAAEILYPALGEDLLSIIRGLTESSHELIPNPIDWLMERVGF